MNLPNLILFAERLAMCLQMTHPEMRAILYNFLFPPGSDCPWKPAYYRYRRLPEHELGEPGKYFSRN